MAKSRRLLADEAGRLHSKLVEITNRKYRHQVAKFPVAREDFSSFMWSLYDGEVKAAYEQLHGAVGAGMFQTQGWGYINLKCEVDANYSGLIQLNLKEYSAIPPPRAIVSDTHPLYQELIDWYKLAAEYKKESEVVSKIAWRNMAMLNTTGQVIRVFPEIADTLFGSGTKDSFLKDSQRASPLPFTMTHERQQEIDRVNEAVVYGLLLGDESTVSNYGPVVLEKGYE